jgi:hypothetical protein
LGRVGGEEIAAPQVGRLVMDELRELDPVAYVRFASVYRRFHSVDAFIEIVERMGRTGARGAGAGEAPEDTGPRANEGPGIAEPDAPTAAGAQGTAPGEETLPPRGLRAGPDPATCHGSIP